MAAGGGLAVPPGSSSTGAYGLAKSARAVAIRHATQTTGISGYEARRTGELSGALRQPLALACAIMHRPAVLFLDEPTSGVDPLARQRFWRLIQSLAASGITVLVTTHYLEEARYCHRLGPHVGACPLGQGLGESPAYFVLGEVYTHWQGCTAWFSRRRDISRVSQNPAPSSIAPP